MLKRSFALLTVAALFAVSLTACGTSSTPEAVQASSQEVTAEGQSQAQVSQTEASSQAGDQSRTAAAAVANDLAEDEESLIAAYADKFEEKTYSDSESGLSITYNLYLPEGYDPAGSYPMVVFIADSSCTGSDASTSLTQGRGALVWASEEWQSAYPAIVAVPTYPETILDDHGSYTTTEYVELTKRFIDYMTSQYAVDSKRIYGSGQSMGCMTTLILASEYPYLYAACMFVDGQWDISALAGLEDQTFVYFAAEDDSNAWAGAQEVMDLFDKDAVSYAYSQWDGTWSVDQLSQAAGDLFTAGENQYFISWKTGTVEAKSGGMGGSGGFGRPGGSGESSTSEKSSGMGPGGFGGPGESTDSDSGEATSTMAQGGPGGSGGMNSSAYHMASFDYAYNCVAVMEWLFAQSR